MRRGILRNVLLSALALVFVLGLTKTQAAAKHSYNTVNVTTDTTATIQYSAGFYEDKKVADYVIYYNEGSYTNWNSYFCVHTTSESYTLTNLKPGTMYAVNVQCTLVDKNGKEYPNMNVLHTNVITQPGKITGVKGAWARDNSYYTLKWDQQSTCDYEVLVTDLKGKKITTVSLEGNRDKVAPFVKKFTGLKTNKNYIIKVRSKCIMNGILIYGAYSDPVVILTAPSIKSAVVKKEGKVLVQVDASAGYSEYDIYASNTYSGSYKKVVTSKAGKLVAFTKLGTAKVTNKKNYFLLTIGKTKVDKKTVSSPKSKKIKAINGK